MKKIKNLFISIFLIGTCSSCGLFEKKDQNTSDEQNQNFVYDAIDKLLDPPLFKQILEEEDFVVGPAYITVANEVCSMVWTCENSNIEITKITSSKTEKAVIGTYVYPGEEIYVAHVNKFEEEEVNITTNYTFNFRNRTYEYDYSFYICDSESYYFHTEMPDWRFKADDIISLRRTEHCSYDWDETGEHDYALNFDCEWNLTTNMFKINILFRQPDTRLKYNYLYDVNNQLLTYYDYLDHREPKLYLNKTYTREDYDCFFQETRTNWKTCIDQVRYVLRDVNKYLRHLGKEELCCVEEATISGKQLFNF